VSWVVEHGAAPSGDYVVTFADKAGSTFSATVSHKVCSSFLLPASCSFHVTFELNLPLLKLYSAHIQNASSIKLPFQTQFLALVALITAVVYGFKSYNLSCK
jgi:hypothetical protein